MIGSHKISFQFLILFLSLITSKKLAPGTGILENKVSITSGGEGRTYFLPVTQKLGTWNMLLSPKTAYTLEILLAFCRVCSLF